MVRTLYGPERHKAIVIAGIWLFPLVGALLAFINTRPRQINPYPIGGDQSPPGIGGL